MFEDKFKDSEQYFALKSFSNLNALTVKEIVHELKLQREVDYHNNIIRFHGITKNQACAVSCLHNENILHCDLHPGNREEPVSDPDIPSDYVKLYKECWDGEPDNRPNMEQEN
ncbi:unnamed protein product [Rhizophagus irregularis]|nr:unnamed protein product [Rhizophagus irregularis]